MKTFRFYLADSLVITIDSLSLTQAIRDVNEAGYTSIVRVIQIG